MKIDELYASAWDNAIQQTADFLNSLNKYGWRNDYNFANDWHVLEAYAAYNDLKFDANGYLQASPIMQDMAQAEGEPEDEDTLSGEDVYRIAADDYDTVASILDDAGCWYEYDEDFDRILLLASGLVALDKAGYDYTEV